MGNGSDASHYIFENATKWSRLGFKADLKYVPAEKICLPCFERTINGLIWLLKCLNRVPSYSLYAMFL